MFFCVDNLNTSYIYQKFLYFAIIEAPRFFILSFTSALVLNIENYIWKVVISFIVIFVLIYALYEIAGRYLKNKEDKK